MTDEDKGQSKLIVRGDRLSGYHMDIFEKTVRELPGLHVSAVLQHERCKVLGATVHSPFPLSCNATSHAVLSVIYHTGS